MGSLVGLQLKCDTSCLCDYCALVYPYYGTVLSKKTGIGNANGIAACEPVPVIRAKKAQHFEDKLIERESSISCPQAYGMNRNQKKEKDV